MPDLSLRICGVRLRLSAEDGAFIGSARSRYAPFLGGGPADLRIDLRLSAGPLRREMEEPRVCRKGRALRVERHDLELDLAPPRGRALLRRGLSPLDASLRIVLSSVLVRRGGFLCHAAALDGWLFPGRSGAGKSTLGRSAPKERLLADELVGVVSGRLFGTPFWGDFRPGRSNVSRPLRALFMLDRRAARGIHPLPKAEALARLLECVLFFEDDPAAAAKVLGLARACVESVPTFVLSYDARKTSFRELEAQVREAARGARFR